MRPGRATAHLVPATEHRTAAVEELAATAQLRRTARVEDAQRSRALDPRAAGAVPVAVEHEIGAPAGEGDERLAAVERLTERQTHPIAEGLEPRLVRHRQRVVMQQHADQAARRRLPQRAIDGGEVGVVEAAMGDERKAGVGAGAVDEHQVQAIASLDADPLSAHGQLRYVVAESIVIPGDHRQSPALRQRLEHPAEAFELLVRTVLCHVTGHHDVVDVAGDEVVDHRGGARLEPR